MEEVAVDFAIVGAGVVGLAVAEALTRRAPSATVAVFERHARFGEETSSHNSEVIHAGLYYGGQPLKARSCISGRELLYAFCRAHGVPHVACGKLIVATEESQLSQLETIRTGAHEYGVPLAYAEPQEVRDQLRNPRVLAALWSPTSGVVDSHALLARLEWLSRSRGALFCYRSSFQTLDRVDDKGLRFVISGPNGECYRVATSVFVNAAGLASAGIAGLFMPDAGLTLRPCRGRYFSLSERFARQCRTLLYPLPDPAGGLGVHLTLDIAGRCRLGPDVDWPSGTEIAPDDRRLYHFEFDNQLIRERFLTSGRRLLPALELHDLSPDSVGVRPKLFVHGRPHADFMVRRSHPSAWHFLGIESPGLTAALALAKDMSAAAV